MAEDKESKTEQPTDKKIEDAREKGRTAKSTEINTVLTILVAVLFFTFLGWWFIEGITLIWRESFMGAGEFDLNPATAHHLVSVVMKNLLFVILPFMFAITVAGILSNFWQNDGWIFSWHPLKPQFNKVNPVTGWKRFLGKEGVVNLAKSMGKLTLIATAVYLSLDDEWSLIPILLDSNVIQTFQILGWETFELVVKVMLILIFIAILDLAYQKWQYKESLKMTKQEVKDERKQSEGDPLVKQRIRQKQFEFFRHRMMAEVPEAEVIITNPTHLSIALRYKRLTDPAPVVVAKGAGHMALRIREIAKEHDIPLVEDKPLAQTLFKIVDIGAYIPDSMFKAVAETLAYVYRLKSKTF